MRRAGLVSKELNRKGSAAPAVAPKPMKPMYGAGVAVRGGMVSKLSVTLPGVEAKKEPAAVNLLNLRQVATRLKLSVNEVKEMLRQGVLRGGLSGVPQTELEGYIRVHRPHLLRVSEDSFVKQGFEETHLPTFRALRRGLMWRLDIWSRVVIGLLVVKKKDFVITLPPAPVVVEGPPTADIVVAALTASDMRKLKLLLEEHMELVLQACDEEENRCLHLAVMGGGYERTFLLVNAGAELNCRNRAGVTPLGLVHQSKRGGWKQVATLLEERGAVL